MSPGPIPEGARPIADPEDPHAGPIPGHAVRADGTVLYWSGPRRGWLPLKPKTGPHGFIRVRVRIGTRVRELGVARLVLRAFEGPCPLGMEPYHFPDPDPANNRLENLRWAPIGSSKVGRMLGPGPPPPRHGEARANAVLTEDLVREVRSLYRAGWPYKEVAAEIGASEEAIRHVLIGRTWSHVPDPEGPIVMRNKGPDSEWSNNAKLDREAAEAIRAGRAAGRTYADLGREFGVDKCTVRDVVKGRTWRGR